MNLRCYLLHHDYRRTFVDGFSFLGGPALIIISCYRCGHRLAMFEEDLTLRA